MEIPKAFKRSKAPAQAQPEPVSQTANPQDEESTVVQEKRLVMIEGRITGRQPVFVDPYAVDEVGREGDSLRLLLKSGNKILFVDPSFVAGFNAIKDLLQTIFSAEKVEKIVALAALTQRHINPDAIECVDFSGGVLQIYLRGGKQVQVGGDITKYRRLMAILCGPEIAEAIQLPKPPKPPLLERIFTPREKMQKQAASEYWTIKAGEYRVVPAGPKVTSTDPMGRFQQVQGVIERMETLMADLAGQACFADEGAKVFQAVSKKFAGLSIANSRLMDDDDDASLEALWNTGVELAAMVSRLNNLSDGAKIAQKYLIEQCNRLPSLSVAA